MSIAMTTDARVDCETVTLVKGPSFGTGPVLRVIHRDGPTWTAIPRRGGRWSVTSYPGGEQIGAVAIRKVRGESLWRAEIGQFSIVSVNHKLNRAGLGVAGLRRVQGLFLPPMPDRDLALRAAFAALLGGQDHFGVYPWVIGYGTEAA